VTVTTTSSFSSSITAAPTYPAGNGTSTATPSATSPIPTAGAAVAGSIGGVAMMILGALAAF
jgi:hypothetical protein